MTAGEWVQIICASAFPIAIVGLFIERRLAGRGIGVRAIQFIAASTFLPGVIILAINGKIDGATAAALVGAFVGYLFASITKFDDRGRD